jgi:serine/threonine protein kinase
MKILKKEYLKKRRQVERTQTERKVLQAVNHPFIMKMHYAFQSEDKLFFVLDYCAGGELFFHLSRFRRFPERVARFYTSELLLAIGHLHKRGIIYRDLKPENVLIDADGHIKLGDFGLAKTGIDHPCEGALSMCGTPGKSRVVIFMFCTLESYSQFLILYYCRIYGTRSASSNWPRFLCRLLGSRNVSVRNDDWIASLVYN